MVYAGYSAGACVTAPTLKGLELCDNPTDLPHGYKDNVMWDGINLVNYSILPHYKSNHPESHMIDNIVDYMKENNVPFRTLHDGEAIVVDGDNEYITGYALNLK